MPIAVPFHLQQVAFADDPYYNQHLMEFMNSPAGADDDDHSDNNNNNNQIDYLLHPANIETGARCYTELTPAIDDLNADCFLGNYDFECLPAVGPLANVGGDYAIFSPPLFDSNPLQRSRDPLICDEFLNSCIGYHQAESSDKVPIAVWQDEPPSHAVRDQKVCYSTASNCSTTHLPSIRCFINGQSQGKQVPPTVRLGAVTASAGPAGSSVVFDLVTQSLTTVDPSSTASLDCFLNDLDSVLGLPDGTLTSAADVIFPPTSRSFEGLENPQQFMTDLTAWQPAQPFSPSADSDSDSAISVSSSTGDLADHKLSLFSCQGPVQQIIEWEQHPSSYDSPRQVAAKKKKVQLDSDSSSPLSPASSSDVVAEDSSWSSSSSPPHPLRRRREKSRTPHLWKFMRALLEDSSYNPEYIKWENKLEGVFRIVPGKSKHIAKLWGLKKNNPSMTFDKLSRSLRWCRKYGFLADLPKSDRYPKKLCFRFAKFALNWVPDQTVTIPSLDDQVAV